MLNVISKPKERLCNHQADTKTTRLYTSKLTFGRQNSVNIFVAIRHKTNLKYLN